MSSFAQNSEIVDRPPPAARGWSRERIVGNALVAIWALFGLGLLLFLIRAWDPDLFEKYAPLYLRGVGVTLSLVGMSIAIGAILSIPIAFARMSRNSVLNAISYAYVYFFRGTPLLAQAFLIYYGFGSFRPQLEAVGLWSFFREAWYCAVLAFSLNTAAYQAEILRGAIESVPRGQWESAASLGLSKFLTMRKIILPQALKIVIPPLVSIFISLFKDTSLVVIIGIFDLTLAAKAALSDAAWRGFGVEAYIFISLIYFVFCFSMSKYSQALERRLQTGHSR